MRGLVIGVLALSVSGCCSPCCPPRGPCCAPVACAPATARATAPAPKNAALVAAERHGQGSTAIWTYLAAAHDKDKDGRVAAQEYTRDAKTFKRLDRDEDGALTAADFAGPTVMEEYLVEFVWRRLSRREDDAAPSEGFEGGGPPRPLDPALLRKAYDRGDANRDGRLTETELTTTLSAAQAVPTKAMPDLPKGVRPFPVLLAVQDGDGSGSVSFAEVEAWAARATEAAQKKAEDAKKAAAKAAEAADPAQSKEPKPDPAKAREGPPIGEPAPAFSLPTREGGPEVALASFKGEKPVALIFGSYTCPPFRHSAIRLRQVVDTYASRVQFLFVYIREAHAVDGRTPMPSADQPLVEEPTTLEERNAVATQCSLDLGFDRFPTLVDGMDNAVARAYAAPPARLYVIDRDGKVAYKGGPGPFGLDPEAFEAAIKQALAP
jgi:hypothetical protein